MKKLIIAIAVFALSSCSHPSPKSERNPAQAFTLTEVSDGLQPDLEKLEAILRPRVVRLDREMITFHYERADTSNYEPHSLQDVQGRMASGYLEKFFDVTDSGGYMEGPGEYVAVDAFSTRSYGGDQPQLYVIPIAKGTPILDTSTYYHDGEQPILEEMWGRLNCGKPDPANPASTIPLSPRSMPEDFSNVRPLS